MRTTRHFLTALTATLLLAAAVSTASARNLSTSNQNIRATWTNLEFRFVGETIRCQVILEGSFHARTIAKVADALIGAITKATIKQETCAGFVAFNGVERYNGTTSPNTLPWHLQYRSFTGTLPAINSVRIALSRFRLGLRDSGGLCTGQYGSATDVLAFDANLTAGAINSLVLVAGSNLATLIRRDGGILCPERLEFSGSASVTLLGATTRITITLI